MYRSQTIPLAPIQSVRVALALCERFDDLVKGPTRVAARKANGALIGFAANDTELSMRIGEAQQLYPEIWRHLDDARTGFAMHGIDLGPFDVLRTTEGKALGADVEVSHREVGAGRYGYAETVKEATFNEAGVARARQAADALMKATPMVDWDAIARAESDDPAVAAFGRARRAKVAVMLGCVGLAIAAPFAIIKYTQHREAVEREERATPAQTTISDEDRAQLALKVPAMRTQVTASLAAWAAATSPAALAALGPSTEPCSLPYRAPTDDEANAVIRTGTPTPELRAGDYDADLADGVHGAPARELQRISAALTDLETRLTDGSSYTWDLDKLAALPHTVTFVLIDADREATATATSPIAYTPGEVKARGYVFSIADAKLVCAATLVAKNPPGSPLPRFLDGARGRPEIEERLHRDLEMDLRRQLAINLHAVAAPR